MNMAHNKTQCIGLFLVTFRHLNKTIKCRNDSKNKAIHCVFYYEAYSKQEKINNFISSFTTDKGFNTIDKEM